MDWNSINWPDMLQGAFAALGVVLGGGLARRKYKEHKAVEAEGIADAVGLEWKELAQVRAEKVEEMHNEMANLRERLAKLEGAYEALQGLKEVRIADRVVELLITTGQLRDGEHGE